ncbi:hypothetical protein [Vibrio fluvialis]|uniref:hypothetical protein n=1 Tax=Vibrio fluvialis TaxID=676 RepID=UPI0023A96D8D|nr:hypothetical protein [Vibrio fluvialis]MDE5179179.1 hypothetical protein [Vibrio fluvialis]
MAKQNVWVVKFIAGNPELFSDVKTGLGSPMKRAKALDFAKIQDGKGWRSWVENESTGERIYESTAEIAFKNQ